MPNSPNNKSSRKDTKLPIEKKVVDLPQIQKILSQNLNQKELDSQILKILNQTTLKNQIKHAKASFNFGCPAFPVLLEDDKIRVSPNDYLLLNNHYCALEQRQCGRSQPTSLSPQPSPTAAAPAQTTVA
jgi:hypothetical protein